MSEQQPPIKEDDATDKDLYEWAIFTIAIALAAKASETDPWHPKSYDLSIETATEMLKQLVKECHHASEDFKNKLAVAVIRSSFQIITSNGK